MGQVEWLVRKMHVLTPTREVIREIYRRLRRAYHEGMHDKKWSDPEHRKMRKKIYRAAIKAHERNRREYAEVMGGGWW